MKTKKTPPTWCLLLLPPLLSEIGCVGRRLSVQIGEGKREFSTLVSSHDIGEEKGGGQVEVERGDENWASSSSSVASNVSCSFLSVCVSPMSPFPPPCRSYLVQSHSFPSSLLSPPFSLGS